MTDTIDSHGVIVESDAESNAKLFAALIAAKKKFLPAKKNAINPHFKSRYVDLATVLEAVEPALLEHGLLLWHQTRVHGDALDLVTILSHVDGGRIDCVWPIRPVKDDPQGLGSAVTYARRYSTMALLGVAAEDDDANEASGIKPERGEAKYPAKKAETSLTALMDAPPKAERVHVGANVIAELDAAKTAGDVDAIVARHADALNALAVAEKKVMREVVTAARKRVNGSV